jgi:hypothetical protein
MVNDNFLILNGAGLMMMKLASLWQDARVQTIYQVLQLSANMLISTPLFLLALLLILKFWR